MFTALLQQIFNCGSIQNPSLTPFR